MNQFELDQLREGGNRYFENKEYEKAISIYSQGLLKDPQNVLLYSNRSLAYLKSNDHQNALEDAMKIIGIAPTDYHGYMRAGAAFRMAQKYTPAEEILTKGYAKTQNAKLLDQYAGILQAQMVESFEKFLTSNEKLKTKKYEDDIFSFTYPANFDCVKREVAVTLHNAPTIEDLENLEKYFICSIVRLPGVLEIGWKKDFWTPVIDKLAADSGVKPAEGVCCIMGMEGVFAVCDDRKILKTTDLHWSVQFCLQSENEKVYFIDIACNAKDIFRLKSYLSCVLGSLSLSEEGRKFDEIKTDHSNQSLVERFVLWADKGDNLQKATEAIGWVFKLLVVAFVCYYFYL